MAHLGVEICQKQGLCEQSQTFDKMTFHPSKQKPNLSVYHSRNVRINTQRAARRMSFAGCVDVSSEFVSGGSVEIKRCVSFKCLDYVTMNHLSSSQPQFLHIISKRDRT